MQQNRDTHTQELVDISSSEQNEQRPTAENRSDIWEFLQRMCKETSALVISVARHILVGTQKGLSKVNFPRV